MSTALVRMKFAAVAAKVETTVGTDVIAGSPASTDWISADCQVSFDPQIINLSEYTGSLDRTASVVGGLRPRLRLRVPLRGSGTAGTAADWTTLIKCCTFAETSTAAAVGAPTAAASGTTTTVTAATPFGTTAQAYRYMPLVVTGDQSFTTSIMNYTAGRVITMGDTRTALTTSSLLTVPVNLLYTPTSDESVYKTATIYFYADGILWAFTGASGTVSVELTTGGAGFLNFDMRAQFSAKSATSVPAGAATAAATRIATVPPRFVNGKMQLNKTLAQVRSISFAANVDVTLPDDPESAEGYGAGVPVGRAFSGSMDPLMNTSNAVSLMTAFRTGTAMNVYAQIGTTAGNRFLVSAANALAIAMDPGDRDGLAQHGISFELNGADSGFGLCAF